MKKWRFLLISALALSLAACNDEQGAKDAEATTEVTENANTQAASIENALEKPVKFVDALGQEVEFTEPPKSIATLNPGIMDILVELGANVTGRPTINAEMSENIKSIQDIGNPHEPSFEQIVALNPEVLIAPTSFQRFAQSITATGIKVVYEEMDSIQDIQDTITRYGEVFANEAKAVELNKEMDEAKAKAAASTKNALIVYGAPGTYLAALDSSLYGDILKAAGGNNIASKLPELDKYPTFANLSAEKIVEGNPQVIMLITHSDPEVVKKGFEKEMSQNATWKNLDAVKNDNIIILPSNLFDNPGTQVVEALDYMRELLEKAEGSN